MRDKTAVLYFSAFVIFVVIMIITVDISPKKLLSGINAAGEDASIAALINERYRREFSFQAAVKTAGAYLPIYSKLSANAAAVYAARFGIYSPPAEAENAFFFSGDGFVIGVDKHLNRVCYESSSTISEGKITAEDALLTARRFMLDFIGEEPGLTLERNDSDGFLFSEQRTLDGLPLDGFSSYALVSPYGKLILCEIYFTEFEKISTRSLLSLEQACLRLPLPDDDIRKVHIKSAGLRYAFFESIVQPVYIFEGKYDDGDEFSVIIPALNFD